VLHQLVQLHDCEAATRGTSSLTTGNAGAAPERGRADHVIAG
jgi:hypothetical protein